MGFRRSSDLSKLFACIDELIRKRILVPYRSLFLDMGCADGRVNVLLSYLVKKSAGVEIDEWTLEEYGPLRKDLENHLGEMGLIIPPDNIFVFNGDTTEDRIHKSIYDQMGVSFEDFDLFYTYLTMYEEFSNLIVRKGKRGSVLMLYGIEKVIPKLEGLKLLTPEAPLNGILALYRKR
ncbi:MAG: hypothetical protein V1930_01175 [Pseudomonadota bacterium]